MKPEAIEKNILAEIMLDNGKIDEIASFLKVKHFAKKENGIIYKAMLEIHNSKQEIDAVSIMNVLKQMEMMNEVGVRYLSEIMTFSNDVYSSANTAFHARVIFENYMKLQLVNEFREIVKRVELGKEDVFELFSETTQKLEDIISEAESGGEDKNLIDLLPEIFQEIDDERLGKLENVRSLKTRNFPSFNKVTGGLRGGNVCVISGYFKKGKTTLSTALMLDFAMQGYNIGIFSLEMSAFEMGMKSISMQTATRYSYLRDPAAKGKFGELRLSDDKFKTTKNNAKKMFSDKKIIISDDPLNDQQIYAKIKHWKKKHNIDIVMIDYLTLIEPTRKLQRNDLEIGYISRQIKQLAKRVDIPVVVVSQENENGDIAESKALSRDSDFWFSITHPIDDLRGEAPNYKIGGTTIQLNQGHFIVSARASRHSQNGLKFATYFYQDGTFKELEIEEEKYENVI